MDNTNTRTYSSITKEQIKNLFETFQNLAVSYGNKPLSLSDSEWFASQYRDRFPSLSEREAVELGKATVNSVARFQATLKEVMAAASGRSKEQWFAETMEKDIEGMNVNEAGRQLRILDQALIAGNEQMMTERAVSFDGNSMVVEMPQMESETGEKEEGWNRFTIKDTLLNIGQNATLVGLQTMAGTGNFDFSSDALEEIQGRSVTEMRSLTERLNPEQMKTLLTAALKMSSESGRLPFLPKAISVDTMGNLASHGVEYYIALSDFAQGRKTLMQTMDHVGMSGVSALYNIFSGEGIKNASVALLSQIPIIGPILGNVVGVVASVALNGKLHEKVRSVVHKVQQTVRSALNSVWEKVKATGKKIKDKIKNFCSWLLA